MTRLSLVLLLAMTAGGCITHSPRRTFDFQDPGLNLPAFCPNRQESPGTNPNRPDSTLVTSVGELNDHGQEGADARSRARCYAHEEHRRYDGRVPHEGFDLHIVEFDDEGQAWNTKQVDASLELLSERLRKQPSVVVTFVHGWKNDAGVCNGNLSCFRDVLDILAKGESRFARISGTKARRVVGIYVGWRGGSISAKWIKQLTFWGRKHAAHTIGDNGAVSSLVKRVRTIVNDSPWRKAETVDTRRTTMVFVGHSFGAALLYSALATSLNADVGEAIQRSIGGQASIAAFDAGPQARQRAASQPLVGVRKPVPEIGGQGDLIVLVNPAMEASRFANLNQVSALRYDPRQVPLIVTLASEGDSAVGFFFPIGQSISTLLRSARSRSTWFSMIEGFGMYRPFHTHRLTSRTEIPVPDLKPPAAPCSCPRGLAAYGDGLIDALTPFYEAVHELRIQAAQLEMAAYQEFLHSRLEPTRDIDPNNPFMMVRVDRDVLGDHNDIFNRRFMDFLIEFVVRTEIKREAMTVQPTGGAR